MKNITNRKGYSSAILPASGLLAVSPLLLLAVSRGMPGLVGSGASGPSPISLQPMRAATVAVRGSAVLSVATEDDEAAARISGQQTHDERSSQ